MRALVGMLSAALVTGIIAAPARADTYEPTRFDDPLPGKCKPNDCSLREAITAANENEGKDKVLLGKGRYKIERPDDGNDDNGDGDFDVSGEATIDGVSPGKTKVDGGGISRVFNLLTFSKHTLSDMTITGGAISTGGAGISNGPAPARLENIVVKENASPDGAGMRTTSVDMDIIDSTFSNNTGGGGIYVPAGVVDSPSLRIRQTTISNNTGPLGAGLYLNGANPDIFDKDPVTTITNSTLARNEADVSGGGIAAILGSELIADNVTIAENKADADDSGGGSGGGIFQSSGASVSLSDSILSENGLGSSGMDPQCSGDFAGIHNVVSLPPGCDDFNNAQNLVTDTEITGLFDSFGGPTKTFELAESSLAKGYATTCPKRDQRGEERPAVCDSGSFEDDPED